MTDWFIDWLTDPFEFLDAVNRAPIKLHTAADAIRPGAEDHRVATDKLDIVRPTSVVSQIEVVGVRRPLGGDRVNLFDTRTHVQLVSTFTDIHLRAEYNTFNQSINQSIDRSTKQRINQPINGLCGFGVQVLDYKYKKDYKYKNTEKY